MRFLFLLFVCFARLHAAPTHHVESQPKITVIGAGLSGLTAAYRLQKMGHGCEIYEARSRPGGRVLTAYFGQNYAELGGTNINDGGKGESMLALIEELGLQTRTQPIRNPRLVSYQGKLFSYPELFQNAPVPTEETFCKLKEKMHRVKHLKELMDLFLEDHVLLCRCMAIDMSGWEGSSPKLLPPEYLEESFWAIYTKQYNFAHEYALGKKPERQMRFVEGGNSRLIDALARCLEIHYDHPLRKITRSADGKIWLHFDKESVFTDYVLLTLPCSTLRDVDIEEGLFPEDQMRAVHALQYGTSAKILLPIALSSPLSTECLTTQEWTCFVNYNQTLLTFYAGGERGVFDSSSSSVLSKIIAEEIPPIRLAFHDIEFPLGVTAISKKDQMFAQYEQPVGISWINEEFSKGGYCNFGLGTYAFFNEFVNDYEESVRKVFRSIDHRIFFAGEHTAPSAHNGTMDGAVYSGERAARMIERALKH
ncbi:MAG TPA: NAD(P)/FAD-dependent oxidoreductase [Rhabdochlamydiaceae bacterium]